MKLNFRKVCLFWGGLDVFYLIRFVWLNVEQGRIPFVDDVVNFSRIYSEHGAGIVNFSMFFVSLLLNVSILFSAILLISGWRGGRYLIFAQIPFRLLFVVPSLSFLPWLLKSLHATGVAVLILALVFSELFKLSTFAFSKNDG